MDDENSQHEKNNNKEDDMSGSEDDEEDEDDDETEVSEETDDDESDADVKLVQAVDADDLRPQCYICLNDFADADVGAPDSCDLIHFFCLDCIEEWSKVCIEHVFVPFIQRIISRNSATKT